MVIRKMQFKTIMKDNISHSSMALENKAVRTVVEEVENQKLHTLLAEMEHSMEYFVVSQKK